MFDGKKVTISNDGATIMKQLDIAHPAAKTLVDISMSQDAVGCLDTNLLDLSLIGVKKVQGGSVSDSFLVEGVAFKKTFSYAGFEQMTKTFTDPKVLLLNVELELKSEKENAEVRITDVSDYQKIVDAEWKIIYDKLDKCVACGAQIILSKLPT